MRTSIVISFFLMSGAIFAQLSWVPCTMPMNTLTNVALGPNGELVTFLPTNPIQPKVSTDHGETWQTHTGTGGPNGMQLSDQQLCVSITGTILLWGNLGSTAYVWRSTDGGDSFTQIGDANGVPASRFFFGFTSNPFGGLYLYGEGVLYSTDDGQNWTSIVPAQTTISALTANSTTLYGAQFSAIYRGELDGTDFAGSNTSGVFVTDGRDLVRGLDDRIIAVGGDDKVITTWDNGNLWYTANTGLGAVPAEWEHVAATLFDDRWVIGEQTSVRFTDDAGASWVTAEMGLDLAMNEPILDIFCDSVGNFYLYGYFHLYRSDFSTDINEARDAAPVHAHPNPTNGLLHVSATMAGTPCRLLDASGREVMRLRVSCDGTLDLGGVEDGCYFLCSADTGAVLSIQVQH